MSLMTWLRRRGIFLATFVLAAVYMVFVEPAWIEVTRFTLSGDRQVGKIRVPCERDRSLDVVLGRLRPGPAGLPSGQDISDIPAWLRKQAD